MNNVIGFQSKPRYRSQEKYLAELFDDETPFQKFRRRFIVLAIFVVAGAAALGVWKHDHPSCRAEAGRHPQQHGFVGC